ncbi:MAG TPA: GAF domain-containing protein [Actinomycetota bacterium]|nr:GAF domain-containing protein [Actinomycetota bacterium]
METDDPISSIHAETEAILAAGGAFSETGPRVLELLCSRLEWDIGLIWQLDEAASVLRLVASWHDPSGPETELERLSMRSTFSPGVGLPGRVLSSGEPWWIRDIQHDRGFPRSSAAAEDGLRSGFGVPLLQGRKVVGMLELFSRLERDVDRELVASIAELGAVVGGSVQADAGP